MTPRLEDPEQRERDQRAPRPRRDRNVAGVRTGGDEEDDDGAWRGPCGLPWSGARAIARARERTAVPCRLDARRSARDQAADRGQALVLLAQPDDLVLELAEQAGDVVERGRAPASAPSSCWRRRPRAAAAGRASRRAGARCDSSSRQRCPAGDRSSPPGGETPRCARSSARRPASRPARRSRRRCCRVSRVSSLLVFAAMQAPLVDSIRELQLRRCIVRAYHHVEVANAITPASDATQIHVPEQLYAIAIARPNAARKCSIHDRDRGARRRPSAGRARRGAAMRAAGWRRARIFPVDSRPPVRGSTCMSSAVRSPAAWPSGSRGARTRTCRGASSRRPRTRFSA